MKLRESIFYEEKDGKTECALCPHNCLITEGNLGKCRVRKNINGKLYLNNYSEAVSVSLDSIEKKPLKMFFPGSKILSVGTYGCNLTCSYCQNWEISQRTVNTINLSPEKLVEMAIDEKKNGNIGIAYTYNEPIIWYEYVIDSAKLVKEKGLKNIFVTNGFINIRPLTELVKYIDAFNIDIKSFNDEFYKKFCGSNILSVLKTIEYLKDKCHIELTALIIPTLNDDENEFENLSKWIAELSVDIPLHITRYFPRYKMDIQSTPIDTLIKFEKIALKYLKNVFIGNI